MQHSNFAPNPLETQHVYSVAQFKGLTYRVTNPTQISNEPSTIDVHRSLMSLVGSTGHSSGYPVIRKIV